MGRATAKRATDAPAPKSTAHPRNFRRRGTVTWESPSAPAEVRFDDVNRLQSADPVVGEKACCFIVPRAGKAPKLEELCAYLLERGIAKYKLPERLETVAEMPLTPTRKIIKGRLAELLAKGV